MFLDLWTGARMHGELEHISRVVSQKRFWREGWIAVRQTQQYDSASLTPEISARLSSLEESLRPRNLVQEVASMVLSGNMPGFQLFLDECRGDIKASMDRAEAVARTLGGAVAGDEQAFGSLLPKLVTGHGQLWSFGMGLAESATDPKAMWGRLVSQLAEMGEGDRTVEVFRGFLAGLHGSSPELVDAILDEAYQHGILGQWYPALQTAVSIDKRATDRLKRSLSLGSIPMRSFLYLANGRATDPISGQDLKELVRAIAERPDGFDIAIQILYMHLHFDNDQKRDHAPECIDAGRELMRSVTFRRNDVQQGYALEVIAQACLGGHDAAAIAQEVCRKLKESIAKYETSALDHNHLLQGLLTVQPAAVLDAIFARASADPGVGIRIFQELIQRQTNPMDVVSKEELARWCDRDPAMRYPIAAAVVTAFTHADGKALPKWTDTALYLLERAPERLKVLELFVRRFMPMSWSGSRATIIESNARLLDDLEGHPDPSVVEFVAREKTRLASVVQGERRAETLADSRRDERFE